MSKSLQAYDQAAPLLSSSETVAAGLKSEVTRNVAFANELSTADKELLAPYYAAERAGNTSEAQRTIHAEFEKAAGFDSPDFALTKSAMDFSGPLPPNLALRAIIKGDVKPLAPSNIVRTMRDKYDALQAQMALATPGSPEHTQLWQQSENIKNQFGGMPPGIAVLASVY